MTTIDTCNFSTENGLDVLIRDHDRELYIDLIEHGDHIHVRMLDAHDNDISIADLDVPADLRLEEK